MIGNLWLVSATIILIWGTLPLLLKSLIKKHPTHVVMLMSAILFGVVGFMFSMYFYSDIRKHVPAFSKQDWLILVYIVVAGSLFSNILYMYALERHNSSIVVAVTSIFPLITLLIGAVLLRERVSWIAVAGIVLITLGVVCLSFNPKTQG